MLLNGNKKCDNDTDYDADGQHDPYVSAMLRRQHNNRYVSFTLVQNKNYH